MLHKTQTELSPHIGNPFITGFTNWEHVSFWWLPHSCLEAIKALNARLTTEGDVGPVGTHFLCTVSSLQTWCIMVCFTAANNVVHQTPSWKLFKILLRSPKTKSLFSCTDNYYVSIKLRLKLLPTKFFHSPCNKKHTFLKPLWNVHDFSFKIFSSFFFFLDALELFYKQFPLISQANTTKQASTHWKMMEKWSNMKSMQCNMTEKEGKVTKKGDAWLTRTWMRKVG